MITYINNVTAAGIVNSLKITKVADSYVYRFVLGINEFFNTKTQDTFIRTTFVPVSYFSSSSEDFVNGDNIKVEGLIDMKRYVSQDSEGKTLFEVKAKTIKKL